MKTLIFPETDALTGFQLHLSALQIVLVEPVERVSLPRMAGGLKDFPLPQTSRKYVCIPPFSPTTTKQAIQFPIPEMIPIRHELVELEPHPPPTNELNLASLISSFRETLALETAVDVLCLLLLFTRLSLGADDLHWKG